MATDLEQAFTALTGKLSDYNTAYDYAEGKQPLLYSTSRLQEAFRNLQTHFQQNWCAVVVDACHDRLNLAGWDVEDTARNNALDDLWNKQRIFLDADQLHRDALITGEAFVIAWKEGDTLDVYRNDPRNCHMFYDPARPKVKRYAAKWWAAGGAWYMTLYYPDHLEYYEANGKDQPGNANAFKPMEPPTAPNPFGAIPVFHYRGPGELGQITSLQDAVNKLFADMMIAAEYGAFKQRYIISNADTSTLKNAPNEIWSIPAGDGQGQQTSVGQFDATPLENYLTAIDKIANSIAIISRTPKHYFYSQGSNLSGEALLAMEAPLTKKVKRYQELFGVTWQELGAFLLQLAGGGTADPSEITPVWKPAESIQPMTEAQVVQTETAAGIPLVTSLRRRGWSESDIQQMLKDQEEEQSRELTNVPPDWYGEETQAQAAGQAAQADGSGNRPAGRGSNRVRD